MSRPNKIEEIAKERGKPADSIVLPLVNKGGQKLAAHHLGVTQSTVSDWLRDNDYASITYWTKKITPQERADIDAAAARINANRIERGLPTLEDEEEFS